VHQHRNIATYALNFSTRTRTQAAKENALEHYDLMQLEKGWMSVVALAGCLQRRLDDGHGLRVENVQADAGITESLVDFLDYASECRRSSLLSNGRTMECGIS